MTATLRHLLITHHSYPALSRDSSLSDQHVGLRSAGAGAYCGGHLAAQWPHSLFIFVVVAAAATATAVVYLLWTYGMV